MHHVLAHSEHSCELMSDAAAGSLQVACALFILFCVTISSGDAQSLAPQASAGENFISVAFYDADVDANIIGT